jgi:hypothetical protein
MLELWKTASSVVHCKKRLATSPLGTRMSLTFLYVQSGKNVYLFFTQLGADWLHVTTFGILIRQQNLPNLRYIERGEEPFRLNTSTHYMLAVFFKEL